jgi:hypothetical protein
LLPRQAARYTEYRNISRHILQPETPLAPSLKCEMSEIMSKKLKVRKNSTPLTAVNRGSTFLSFERLMIGVPVLATLIILAAVYILRDKPLPKLDPNIPDESVAAEDQGQKHIEEHEPHDPYNTNPPTSGSHNASPLTWGVYNEVVPDDRAIHNLEHGGIWISYRDRQDKNLITALEDIAKRYQSHLLLSYRPENDNPIAVAAWSRLLTLEQLDSDQIYNFIARYQFQGPEDVR